MYYLGMLICSPAIEQQLLLLTHKGPRQNIFINEVNAYAMDLWDYGGPKTSKLFHCLPLNHLYSILF